VLAVAVDQGHQFGHLGGGGPVACAVDARRLGLAQHRDGQGEAVVVVELEVLSERASALEDQCGASDASDQCQQAAVLDVDARPDPVAQVDLELRERKGGRDKDQAEDGESDVVHLVSYG
jgi:hypothetical protein